MDARFMAISYKLPIDGRLVEEKIIALSSIGFLSSCYWKG